MKKTVGQEKLVLDLSCRKKEGQYYIVTDRWQKFTQVPVTEALLEELGDYCDEFLIHGVDVEGKAGGIEIPLVQLLAEYKAHDITYAGGVGSLEDLEILQKEGKNRLDFTIGSALDLFGGSISFQMLLEKWGNRKVQKNI